MTLKVDLLPLYDGPIVKRVAQASLIGVKTIVVWLSVSSLEKIVRKLTYV